MRFPTHNAQWLHKSNKLINFWNTLRSLSSAAASICLVVVVTQTVCTQNRTGTDPRFQYPLSTTNPSSPIQLPSYIHNPVSILIPIHRSNPFATHPLQQLQQRTLIIEFWRPTPRRSEVFCLPLEAPSQAELSAAWIKRKQNWLIAGQTPFQRACLCTHSEQCTVGRPSK